MLASSSEESSLRRGIDAIEAGRSSRIKTHHELLHSRDFLCCCCFHVRTGTIAFGLVHLMMQMIIVALLATAVYSPETLSLPKTTFVQSGSELEQDNQETLNFAAALIRYWRQDLVSALLLSTLTALISMLFVYGAFWGHPPYLLPFFAIFCCDFATAMLRLIGSFAEHHAAQHTQDGPLHGFYLMTTVIIKAYLLNMIWSCYKFLRLRQELMRNPPVTMSSQPATATRPAVMEASQLLSDFEATQKYPYNFYAAPPPSYIVAMQMPAVGQVVVPPPSYDDVAGTSRQLEPSPETTGTVDVEVKTGATATVAASSEAQPSVRTTDASNVTDTEGLNASKEART